MIRAPPAGERTNVVTDDVVPSVRLWFAAWPPRELGVYELDAGFSVLNNKLT